MIHQLINHCPRRWRWPLARLYYQVQYISPTLAPVTAASYCRHRAQHYHGWQLDSLTARVAAAVALHADINWLLADGCERLVCPALKADILRR